MAKLYGITKTFITPHVIGYGKRCIVWNVYLSRRNGENRIKMSVYKTDADKIIFNMLHNSERFWFFGYLSASREELE